MTLGVAVPLLLASPAVAGPGNTTLASVYGVMPHYSGLFFYSTGTPNSRPACVTTDQLSRWVINTTTSQGQAMVAALLSAYSLKKRVTVFGTGACDVWGDTETVSHFVIED